MQAAKDTFLKALADRLTVANPARTVVMDGAPRPAVLALENESPLSPEVKPETFLLSWEGIGQAMPEGPLMYLDCKLSYGSGGTNDMLRMDRGRILTAMDRELLKLCEPNRTAKYDYTLSPPSVLGTNVFWTWPVMEAPSEMAGVIQRTAAIRVFFFPEVA